MIKPWRAALWNELISNYDYTIAFFSKTRKIKVSRKYFANFVTKPCSFRVQYNTLHLAVAVFHGADK